MLYKLLKIKTLKKGWHDKDEIILHACFQLLTDFMEKEKPGEWIDWESDEHHSHAWKEIQDLYDWWKNRRSARFDPLYDDETIEHPPFETRPVEGRDNLWEFVPYDKEKYADYEKALQESQRLEEEWNEEDQKNLHRLIDIRFYLWT